MKINLPFYSQYSDTIEKDWQNRSCAIVCLQVVLKFYGKEIQVMDLIKEGVVISNDLIKMGRETEGYTQEFGWGHELLVALLRNHGLSSYRQDFRSVKFNLLDDSFSKSDFESEILEFGINKIKENIFNNKPVIVSLSKDVSSKKTSGHMVVVSGFEDRVEELNGFYIKDPEQKTSFEDNDVFISLNEFKEVWKKLAVFVN